MTLAERIAQGLADGKRAKDIARELNVPLGMVSAVRRDRNPPAHWQLQRYSSERIDRQFAVAVDCSDALAAEDPLEQPADVDDLWQEALHGSTFDAFRIPTGRALPAPRRETYVPAVIGIGAVVVDTA